MMQSPSLNLERKERKVAPRDLSGGGVVKTPRGKRRSVSLKLAIVARRLRMKYDQRVEEGGLTRAQWSVLAVVSRRPGATQRTLANLLSVTDVTAGRMVDRLCADGYLERRENPEDRRAYRVYLTDKARPVLARLSKLSALFEEEVFAGFSDEDLARLDKLLGLMARNLADVDFERG
jgi:MarR family transcriptional regulator, transcriptional regulator for hemolysin